MGIMDKIKRATGADEQYDDIYPEDSDYADYPDGGLFTGDRIEDAPTQNVNVGGDPGWAGGIGGSSFPAGGISLSGNMIELKVVKPERFESVTQIADHLLKKRTVVLNLESTNKETARRLIDFLSGVAYSIEGSLKKIASNAYVITPANVDVGDAQLRSRQTAEKEESEQSEEQTYSEI